MKWIFRKTPAKEDSSELLRQFIHKKQEVEKLPQLSAVDKAEFDHGVDIEHLYYSSKIEGTNLTEEQIRDIPRAAHAK